MGVALECTDGRGSPVCGWAHQLNPMMQHKTPQSQQCNDSLQLRMWKSMCEGAYVCMCDGAYVCRCEGVYVCRCVCKVMSIRWC